MRTRKKQVRVLVAAWDGRVLGVTLLACTFPLAALPLLLGVAAWPAVVAAALCGCFGVGAFVQDHALWLDGDVLRHEPRFGEGFALHRREILRVVRAEVESPNVVHHHRRRRWFAPSRVHRVLLDRPDGPPVVVPLASGDPLEVDRVALLLQRWHARS